MKIFIGVLRMDLVNLVLPTPYDNVHVNTYLQHRADLLAFNRGLASFPQFFSHVVIEITQANPETDYYYTEEFAKHAILFKMRMVNEKACNAIQCFPMMPGKGPQDEPSLSGETTLFRTGDSTTVAFQPGCFFKEQIAANLNQEWKRKENTVDGLLNRYNPNTNACHGVPVGSYAYLVDDSIRSDKAYTTGLNTIGTGGTLYETWYNRDQIPGYSALHNKDYCDALDKKFIASEHKCKTKLWEEIIGWTFIGSTLPLLVKSLNNKNAHKRRELNLKPSTVGIDPSLYNRDAWLNNIGAATFIDPNITLDALGFPPGRGQLGRYVYNCMDRILVEKFILYTSIIDLVKMTRDARVNQSCPVKSKPSLMSTFSRYYEMENDKSSIVRDERMETDGGIYEDGVEMIGANMDSFFDTANINPNYITHKTIKHYNGPIGINKPPKHIESRKMGAFGEITLSTFLAGIFASLSGLLGGLSQEEFLEQLSIALGVTMTETSLRLIIKDIVKNKIPKFVAKTLPKIVAKLTSARITGMFMSRMMSRIIIRTMSKVTARLALALAALGSGILSIIGVIELLVMGLDLLMMVIGWDPLGVANEFTSDFYRDIYAGGLLTQENITQYGDGGSFELTIDFLAQYVLFLEDETEEEETSEEEETGFTRTKINKSHLNSNAFSSSHDADTQTPKLPKRDAKTRVFQTISGVGNLKSKFSEPDGSPQSGWNTKATPPYEYKAEEILEISPTVFYFAHYNQYFLSRETNSYGQLFEWDADWHEEGDDLDPEEFIDFTVVETLVMDEETIVEFTKDLNAIKPATYRILIVGAFITTIIGIFSFISKGFISFITALLFLLLIYNS